MHQQEIEQRSHAVISANPPFPAVFRGVLFPAGSNGQPVVVPVPLDYGLGSYMFPEDLRTQSWTVTQFKNSWRMDAGHGVIYLAYAYAQRISKATGALVNSSLSDSKRVVYGDVLVLKESQLRECIVDLDEADFKHVVDRFTRWWAIHGSDPDQLIS